MQIPCIVPSKTTGLADCLENATTSKEGLDIGLVTTASDDLRNSWS